MACIVTTAVCLSVCLSVCLLLYASNVIDRFEPNYIKGQTLGKRKIYNILTVPRSIFEGVDRETRNTQLDFLIDANLGSKIIHAQLLSQKVIDIFESN